MSIHKDSKHLREQVRLLERKLGILNENDLTCCGVTMAQCHAIVEIGRAAALSLSDLAVLLDLDNSTTSRTVNNLVTRGLVQRDTAPEDRRYVSISLTSSGIDIFKSIESRMDARFSAVYEKLPENRREQILEALELLLDALGDRNCC